MRKYLGLAAVSGLLSLGCGPEGPVDCVCSADFRAVQFLVTTPFGAPVPITGVNVTLTRTGQALAVPQPGGHAGIVNVVDDSFMDRLVPAGDAVQVEVTTAVQDIRVDLSIGVDQPCSCHVLRISGPTQVVIPTQAAETFAAE